jgi:hypothetical protein
MSSRPAWPRTQCAGHIAEGPWLALHTPTQRRDSTPHWRGWALAFLQRQTSAPSTDLASHQKSPSSLQSRRFSARGGQNRDTTRTPPRAENTLCGCREGPLCLRFFLIQIHYLPPAHPFPLPRIQITAACWTRHITVISPPCASPSFCYNRLCPNDGVTRSNEHNYRNGSRPRCHHPRSRVGTLHRRSPLQSPRRRLLHRLRPAPFRLQARRH